MGDFDKKILCNYRFKPAVVEEINSLAEASGIDMTEIVSLAIMNVRPILSELLNNRLLALRALKPASGILEEIKLRISEPNSGRPPEEAKAQEAIDEDEDLQNKMKRGKP